MQLKKQISFTRYAILTFIHLVPTFYYFGKGNELVLSILFISFFLNHLFLVLVVKGAVLDDAAQRDNVKIFLFFMLKFVVLIGGIYYGYENFKGQKLIIIGNYIFQLIILTLSIKRYSKKIKE
jgi:hypothetical protein